MRLFKLSIALLLVLVLTWASTPQWLPLLAGARLAAVGLHLQRLEIGRPGLHGVSIPRLQLVGTGAGPLSAVDASGLEVTYRLPDLVDGRIQEIRAARLDVMLDLTASTADERPPTIDLRLPARLAARLPLARWSVSRLSLDIIGPAQQRLRARGRLSGEGQRLLGHLDARDERAGKDWRLTLDLTAGNAHRIELMALDQAGPQLALSLNETQRVQEDRQIHSKGLLTADLALLSLLPMPSLPLMPAGGQVRLSWAASLPALLAANRDSRDLVRAEGRLQTEEVLLLGPLPSGDPSRVQLAANLGWHWHNGLLELAPQGPQGMQVMQADGTRLGLDLDTCTVAYAVQEQIVKSPSCEGTLSLTLSPGTRVQQEFGLHELEVELAPQLRLSARLNSSGTLSGPLLPEAFQQAGWKGAFSLSGGREQFALRPLGALQLQVDAKGGKVPVAVEMRIPEIRMDLARSTLDLAGLRVSSSADLNTLLPRDALPAGAGFSHGAIQLRFSRLQLQDKQVNAQGSYAMHTLGMTWDDYRAGPLDLQGAFELQGEALRADWQLQAGAGRQGLLAGQLHYRLDQAQAQSTIELVPNSLPRVGGLLRELVRPWPAELQLHAGSLGLSGEMLGGRELQVQASAGIDDGALSWGDYALSGMQLSAAAAVDGAQVRFSPLELYLQSVDVGFPLRNLRLRAQPYMDGRMRIDTFSVELLGGRVSAEDQFIDLNGGGSPLRLRVEGLALQQLLKLQGQEKLEGTGTIDGELPVHISPSGVTMDAGSLRARLPGGTLRYLADDSTRAMAGNNQGLRIALDALQDFHYDVLRADADYQADGRLLLNLRIEGSNPAVQAGRPIHLNLNVEQNLLKLLESLRYADEIGERLQQRMESRP